MWFRACESSHQGAPQPPPFQGCLGELPSTTYEGSRPKRVSRQWPDARMVWKTGWKRVGTRRLLSQREASSRGHRPAGWECPFREHASTFFVPVQHHTGTSQCGSSLAILLRVSDEWHRNKTQTLEHALHVHLESLCKYSFFWYLTLLISLVFSTVPINPRSLSCVLSHLVWFEVPFRVQLRLKI